VKAGKSKLSHMEDVMKNLTVVVIGVVGLMISGQTLAAARPLGSLGFGGQSAQQQQAMERLREQQERMREQQERMREQQEERLREQEQERQREQQQERMREQQQEQQQERLREQQQERLREQGQERQRETQRPEPENRRYNNVQPEGRANLGANHANSVVLRPAVIAPAMRHALTYNTRPGGIHLNPAYFAAHFGYSHGFHFTNYAGGACIGDCGLRKFGEEWYFNANGGWFGIMGQMPGNWGLQTDYLYIDVGDDGNYYLYDAQFPDVAVQLTFVQNIGDDQAGADEDQGDQSDQSQQ
jgi:hypothetical protein